MDGVDDRGRWGGADRRRMEVGSPGGASQEVQVGVEREAMGGQSQGRL